MIGRGSHFMYSTHHERKLHFEQFPKSESLHTTIMYVERSNHIEQINLLMMLQIQCL